MKSHIEKNTVQEMLIIPLFGRLVCSERFPQLFSDPEAERICRMPEYGANNPPETGSAEMIIEKDRG